MKKAMIVLFAGSLTSASSYAQAPDPDTTARHFIIMASIGNLQEVNAGKLALQKATRIDVRSFAEMMVTDHSQAERKLLQLASKRGYQIPAAATEPPVPDPNMSKASGDDLDRIYIHAMVAGHRNTVSMFQNYALTGKYPEVRAFAQQMLPALKKHLAAVKALDEKYKNLTAQ